MMKVYFQTWITFEIQWGNEIFAPLRIMYIPLKILKLNYRLGNADFDRGTLWKSWNRNCQQKMMKVDFQTWITFEIL
jgi:hypothetical protein